MNMCSTKNSRRRARYGYKPFSPRLLLLFTSLWSKIRNSSPKVFLMAKAATNSLPRPPQFLSVFKTSYQQLGIETSPVIGLNYLLLVGQIWWRTEVTQFVYDTWPYFYRGCQKLVPRLHSAYFPHTSVPSLLFEPNPLHTFDLPRSQSLIAYLAFSTVRY